MCSYATSRFPRMILFEMLSSKLEDVMQENLLAFESRILDFLKSLLSFGSVRCKPVRNFNTRASCAARSTSGCWGDRQRTSCSAVLYPDLGLDCLNAILENPCGVIDHAPLHRTVEHGLKSKCSAPPSPRKDWLHKLEYVCREDEEELQEAA